MPRAPIPRLDVSRAIAAATLIVVAAAVAAVLALKPDSPASRPRPASSEVNVLASMPLVATPTPSQSPSTAVAAARGSTAGLAARGTPDRLVIAAIGVDAHIEGVGTTSDGRMDVPRDVWDVGWYAPGVKPGMPGDAVIDGHLDWYTGPAVFWHLNQVRVGDTVDVQFVGGGIVHFRVTRMAAYGAASPPSDLFGRGGPPRLTLITCAGRWDGRSYTERLVVNADLA